VSVLDIIEREENSQPVISLKKKRKLIIEVLNFISREGLKNNGKPFFL
jgi:hypothetical protein